MWRYVSETSVIPTNTNNAKIITWINNSVERSIGTLLAKYEKTKGV